MNITAVALGALVAISCLFLLVHLSRELRLIGRLRRRGIGTLGTVVNHVPSNDTVDRPVIHFTDRQGRQFRFEAKHTPFGKFVPAGERVSVVYLSGQPSQSARVISETNFRSQLPGLLGLLVFLACGIMILVLPWTTAESTESAPLLSSASPPLVRSLALFLLGTLPGLAILFYVGRKIRQLYILRRDGLRTTGTVARMIKDDSVELVIDFFDSRNRRIQFTSDRGPRQIGATVPVVYLRDRPHHAAVAPALRNAMSLWLPTLVGTVFLTVGVTGTLFSL